MARYLETAAEANKVAVQLLALVPDDVKPTVAEMIARLVNLGVRCSPRGVQHTVRYNAVRAAVRGLPVIVCMEPHTDENTGRVYHALVTKAVFPHGSNPLSNTEAVVEGLSEK